MADPENTNLYQVTSSEHFKSLLSADLQRVSLLYFWASWAQPCAQMTEVFIELARKYPTLLSLQIEAEANEEISESFNVESVPSFIVLQVRRPRIRFLSQANSPPPPLPLSPRIQGHTLLARIEGADAAALTTAIAKHVGAAGGGTTATPPLSRTDKPPATALTTSDTPPEELEQRLRGLMNQSTVVLFMKGTPEVPRCGFSRKICDLLRENGVEFSHFDILTDESVRQGGRPPSFLCS